jgi:hypothetical protein
MRPRHLGGVAHKAAYGRCSTAPGISAVAGAQHRPALVWNAQREGGPQLALECKDTTCRRTRRDKVWHPVHAREPPSCAARDGRLATRGRLRCLHRDHRPRRVRGRAHVGRRTFVTRLMPGGEDLLTVATPPARTNRAPYATSPSTAERAGLARPQGEDTWARDAQRPGSAATEHQENLRWLE